MELYLNYNRKSDIHGTVLYPAPMIAPLQFDVLNSIVSGDNLNILDPFHGSGISIFEAATINKSFNIYGFDINPFANLITKSKFYGVSEKINDDIFLLKSYLFDDSLEFPIHYFDNINKWFKDNIIISLSRIRHSISLIDSYENRLYFWSMFSNVVRRFSNTRSSTYKLHIRPEEQIENIKDNVIDYYLNIIETNVHFYTDTPKNNFIIKKTDSLEEMKNYHDGYFDIIITSPPYGDNGTTVPYGQFSSLALFWIDSNDLELEGWELNNYSIIDSNSMGGKSIHDVSFNSDQLVILNKYLVNIECPNKKIKVEKFMFDYFIFLDEIDRLSNKYIILTLGNRTVDNVKIDLTDISKTYLELKNFKCNDVIERELQNKRIPKRTSNVNSKTVSSINKEYLLIMEKK